MIKVTVRGVEELQKFLSDLPRGSKITAMRAATEYLIGNDQRGLKHEPKYKFVDRTSAYGFPFFTDKQRRWFFWALGEGIINPGVDNRTHEIVNSWKSSESDSNWTSVKITNDADGAKWVFGDKTQARQPARVGWRTVSAIISTNIKGMIQAAERAVQAWIKAHEK